MSLVPAQPLQMQVEDKDQHGNLVMDLSSIGLTTPVRFKRMPEGPRISEIDVVKAFCGKSSNEAAEVIRKMGVRATETMQEVRLNSITSKFSGRGQQNTTLLTLDGVLKLLMVLPGNNARVCREKCIDVVKRYFAGDPTLVAELADNYASMQPINVLARESAGVPEPLPGESRELAFDNVVQQVLQDTRLKNIICDAAREEMAMVRQEYDRQRKRKLYDDRMQEKRRQNEHNRSNVETQNQVLLSNTRMEEMKLEMAKNDHTRQFLKDQAELIKVVNEAKKSSVPDPMTVTTTTPGMQGPYTIERVANHFGMTNHIIDSKYKEKVLANAGRLARSDKYNLAPLPVKVWDGRHNVYQYHAESVDTLKIVIKEAVDTTPQDAPAHNNTNTIHRCWAVKN